MGVNEKQLKSSRYFYSAFVISAYDGDTVTLNIDLGFKITKRENVRLYGIDSPELRGDEREKGIIARDSIRKLILNRSVYVQTVKDKKGKYGRLLATLWLPQDDENVLNVNDWMVINGYAVARKY